VYERAARVVRRGLPGRVDAGLRVERLSRDGYAGFALAATDAEDVLDERGQNPLAGVPPAYVTEDHRDI
jgi:hypothetical protein